MECLRYEFLTEVRSSCGFALGRYELRWITLFILQPYLWGSAGLFMHVLEFAHSAIVDDGFDLGSFAMYCLALILDLLLVIVPTVVGIFGAIFKKPVYLRRFVCVNKIFLVMICVAFILCFGKLIWMLVSAAIAHQSIIKDDILWMIAITVITALFIPLLYFLTSLVYTYRTCD